MASSAATISQPASTGMNQVPPEIMTVMSLRGVYRASGNRATFPAEVVKIIADIKADLPASPNVDGLQKINNWRGGGGGGAPHAKTTPVRQGAMTSDGRYSNQQQRSQHGNTFRGRGEQRQDHRSSAGPERQDQRTGGTATQGTNAFGPSRFKNSSLQSSVFGTSAAPAPPAVAQQQHHAIVSVAGVPTTPNGSPAVPLVSPSAATNTLEPAAPAPPQRTTMRYVSKFTNSSVSTEKTIVNTLIRGKLNKFTSDNYDDIKEFLMVILETGDEDPNFLHDFMKLIFTKAAEEELYCPLYAQLLHDLSARFPYLIEEMTTLYKRFMAIFEEVSEKSVQNYTDLLERNKEKRYRTGYSQFIVELYNHRIIDQVSFKDTVSLIVNELRILTDTDEKINIVEEYVGCLNKIMTGLKGRVPADIKEKVATLNDLTVKGLVKPSMSSKVRFALMDVINIV
jgi:hypothetical protein